jgi:hypothetical protein
VTAQISRFVKAEKQLMEINEPGIRFPFGDQPAHALIIERLPETESLLESISSAHIVARKNLYAA